VLDHLAVCVDAENVDTGVLMVARPRLVAVQHDVLALREGAPEINVLAGVLGCHPFEVVARSAASSGQSSSPALT
jgi:hypothetical protein